MLKRFPIHPGALWGIVKEVRAAAEDFRPTVAAGHAETTAELTRALTEGGDPSAVRDLAGRRPEGYDLDGAGLLLYAVEGPQPSAADLEVFRQADRKDVETICLLVGATGAPPEVPYVLATDVIPVSGPLPLEHIVERIVERLDADRVYAHAARLPVLRRQVAEAIVQRFSRQNGIVGAAVFIPGADLPVLTLNQIRMVLNLAAAHGQEIDRERALELAAVIGAGLGLRALARQALVALPGPRWALKGAIAYTATRALGEAAISYFEAGGQGRLKDYVRSRS